MATPPISSREWLEADGLGGFASGTGTGIRTRRYHALLLTATTPPTGRVVLVNGFDAWIETPAGRFELTSQHYAPDILGGSGVQHIEQFTAQPWPRWILVECPTGSKNLITINEVADELSRRLTKLFLKGEDGERPVLKYHTKLATDPHFKDYVLFHEYFHGDNGRGIGASHQTGWTGLVAKLLQPRSRRREEAETRNTADSSRRGNEAEISGTLGIVKESASSRRRLRAVA